ncbi:GntR family transcriptional regulator [Mesorhizobium sp. INR15]|uniref:GntR family transcriptional regulator n=1 Tax=Mesorhizobium sp. INR15 TaxID=2654248 RepID=UPI001896610D|nr:GntR family transcriptional regulator [Mesorhizobium sp. INR15]QPC95500.1 FCD domain-containing protein [Mesorhizobium sp. INR15]
MTRDQSLTETAYEAILNRILDGRLKPGARLQERPLGDELSLSRTPVREALSRLENEGLVSREQRVSIVRTITLQDFLEILHVRMLLETDAVGLACGNIPAEELQRLKARAKTMKGASKVAATEFDSDLHGTILDHSGNRTLAGIVAQLRKKTAMFNVGRIPERTGPVVDEHLAIIEALIANDAEAARKALSTHLGNVRASIASWISNYGRPNGT